jgi:GTPase SAR1 family protein
MMHLPENEILGTSQLKQSKAGSAQAPLDLQKNGISLGKNIHRNVETDIYMSPEDRLRHLYIIGQTGTGKTTLLKQMIRQDILNGDGVCVIDPHGSDIQDVLSYVPKERLEDLVYFDPSYTARPMGLNMLEYDIRFPEQKTFVVNEMLSIFNKLFDMKVAGGPMFEQYFRNSVMLVLEDPESGNTLLDVSRVLSNKQFRDLKISKCKNPLVIQFWKEIAEKAGGEASLANIVPYIVSKFDVFLQNDIMRPIIAQEKSSFNFREIMDQKKILLVNLSKGRLGDINANLIGLIIVGKILMAALSRVDSLGKDLAPFYLYIDEFQNITTDSISTIFSEARKYKLSLTVAHQFIAQLEEDIRDSVFGNVGSIASFRVSSEDAEYLEKQFAPTFSAKDLMSIDNLNCYMKMLASGRPVKPFNLFIPFPPRGDNALIDKVKELSYLKYGRDRELVESEIMKKYEKKPLEEAPPVPVSPFKI